MEQKIKDRMTGIVVFIVLVLIGLSIFLFFDATNERKLKEMRKFELVYMTDVGPATIGYTLGNLIDTLCKKKIVLNGEEFTSEVANSGSKVTITIERDTAVIDFGKRFQFFYECNANDKFCLVSGGNAGGENIEGLVAMELLSSILELK